MVTQTAAHNDRNAAIQEAGQIVVAAVVGLRSGSIRGSPLGKDITRANVESPIVSVAASVAGVLAEDPGIKDSQIECYVFCDCAFASCSDTYLQGLDLDNLLEPIKEARSILVEYEWLHQVVTERLIQDGTVAEADILAALRGGPNALHNPRNLPLMPLLAFLLLALIVEHV
jgi:hypothetical protein